MKTKKHINIPVFIPHSGCPHQCVFCNQRIISGEDSFNLAAAEDKIKAYLSAAGAATETEIAFFGGSFTGIPRADMIFLLETARKYINGDPGKISSIRISTRPDYINDEILFILKKYGVKTIELGIQCLNGGVLKKCKRGHTAEQAEEACRLVKEYGFGLIGQMMIGLPSASGGDEEYTAERICRLNADGARIYPAVVFKGTELAYMTAAGDYAPLTVCEAVKRTAAVLQIFAENKLPVIRIGLCSSENLNAGAEIYAGGYHPAFGELAESEAYYNIISAKLDRIGENAVHGSELVISCPKGAMSKVIGHKRRNKLKIQSEYNVKNIKIIENDAFWEYNYNIDIIILKNGEEIHCV